MKPFLGEDFLLDNHTARHLYHDVASSLPIYDYHCHLPPEEIAENRRFENLTELWLEGDHYKWRAMRALGIDESLVSGDADPKDKFIAWAEAMPKLVGNPLYHWSHLELRGPLGIAGALLSSDTAETVWQQANERLKQPEYSARGLITRSNVVMIGTTDDPCDDLAFHQQIREDDSFAVEVCPTFRPDMVFKIESADFVPYLSRLGGISGTVLDSWHSLVTALGQRLDHFETAGCRSADHGIERVRFAPIPTDTLLDEIVQKRLSGDQLSQLEISQFSTAMLVWLGREYHRRDWVMQFHIGAQRNNNRAMFESLGRDSGFDSIGDRPYASELAGLLDSMAVTGALPKTILYCLNPRDNEMIATMTGNFQGGIPGRMQFGSGWWFNDQKDGMERQLQQLSQLGVLSQFVGMLTDSRSLLSYVRHEYFRRILCNLLGTWVERGEAPNDETILSTMVRDICFANAERYFQKRHAQL